MKSNSQLGIVALAMLICLVANASAQPLTESADAGVILLGSLPASDVAQDAEAGVEQALTTDVLPSSIVLGVVYQDESAPYVRLDDAHSAAAFASGANGSGFVLATPQQAIAGAPSLPWLKGN